MLMGSRLRRHSQWAWSQVWCFCKLCGAYVRKWMFFSPVTSLLCDLAWKKCNPSGAVNSRKAKGLKVHLQTSDRKERVIKRIYVWEVCVQVCGGAHSLTSSLRSDPPRCMYHRIWACWDLGIHSRNVELLCTPKRTLSSTCPPTRPTENTTVIDPRVFTTQYSMQVSSSD